MSSNPLTPLPLNPTLTDVLAVFEKHLNLTFKCHDVGIIESFDTETQTATVKIAYKKVFYQVTNSVYKRNVVDYTPIITCPVFFAGGGTASQTFPVAQGDECLILFNDRDIDAWWAGSNSSEPDTPRTHSYSDALVIVGFRSKPNAIQNFDNARACLRNKNALVGVGPELVKIANENHTLNALLSELVSNVKDLVSATSQITVSGVTTGGGVSAVPVNAAEITSVSTSLTITANKIAELLE